MNYFMGAHKNDGNGEIDLFRKEFKSNIDLIYEKLGVNAFRNYGNGKFTVKFHPAIYDALMIAFYLRQKRKGFISEITSEQHKALLENDDFKAAISSRTTDIKNIRQRIQLVGRILFKEDAL